MVSHLSSLVFTFQSASVGVGLPTISKGQDAFKADGDGFYDIKFSFSQPPVSAFSSGDYVTYLISGVTGLASSDFTGVSAHGGGAGQWYAAAHVQGINATGDNDCGSMSGWVNPNEAVIQPVPEPSIQFLVGACISTGAWWARRRSRK